MNKYIVFFLAGVFLFVSCVSTGKPAPQSPIRPADISSPQETLPVLSLEELYDGGHWIAVQPDGGLTVMGIAGRRANRDEAIAEALADAARKVALYYGVQGESASVLNQGSGNLEYYRDFDYKLNLLSKEENYINDLVYDNEKDVLEKSGVVVVRVKYAGVSGIPSYKSVVENGMPDWVKNYGQNIEIPGFWTAVSYSKNKGSPQKTFQASYENAIVSLLPRLSSKTANELVDVGGGRFSQNYSVNYGVLERVVILETWTDKEAGIIWTLLMAKPKN
ncbi:MAG: hypothetical protein LBS06_02895 [Treponema sp.]|jgi:hypothetical protein|nr:hypothetical protein [Treponema sp.]